MDSKQIYLKVVGNKLSYDEALRIVGYIEKTQSLLGYNLKLNTEQFLNKSLDLSLTEEDAEDIANALEVLNRGYENYLQKLNSRPPKTRSYEGDEEYRPRHKKKGHR